MAAWPRVAPEAHLVESTNLAWMPEGLAARASALAAAGLQALNLHRSQWDEDTLREVRAAGLLAFGWDAQARDDIRKLVELGLDGVYSDHVDVLMAAIRAGTAGRVP
jgi:glycerophosphoryl diester phosphodiesterase